MQSACIRLVHSVVQDGYGEAVEGFAPEAEAQPCRFEVRRLREHDDLPDIGYVDAVAHVELERTWLPLDRFQLTNRWGEPVEPPEEYEIVGVPMKGMAAQRLELRRRYV